MFDYFKSLFSKRHSLRFRIVTLSLLIEVIMLSILVWNSMRLTEESLATQEQHQLEELLPILNSALGPPMLSNDTATLQETVQHLIREEGIYYAKVVNILGEKLFEQGTSRTDQNPDSSNNLRQHIIEKGADSSFYMRMPITLNNYPLGYLDFELDLHFIDRMTKNIRNQSLLIASIEIVLSLLLLTLLGLVLTRKLQVLGNAAQQMSQGNLSIRTHIPGHDEVSATALAFNQMAQAIDDKTEALNEEQKRLRTLLDTMKYGVVFTDSDNTIKYHNQAFLDIWSIETSVQNQTLIEAVESSNPNVSYKFINDNEVGSQLNAEIVLDSGMVILQSSQPIASTNTENSGATLWIFENITKQREAENQLTFLAEHDPLTGLYNRYYFKVILPSLATQVERNNRQLALFFFDLDEFKAINDTYGHEQGDEVLNIITQVVSLHVRDEDHFFRLGGDEFAILCFFDDKDDLLAYAERIVKSIASSTFQFETESTRITASLGISCYPATTEDPEQLISQADIAMYYAKSTGKNNSCLYHASQDKSITPVSQLSWNKRIDDALEKDLFELHFQGIYNVQTETISHLECLIRLHDETDPNKLIYPNQFIPLAERTGQILHIDRWVIHQATKLLAEHPHMPPLAVNVSGKSIDEPSLPEFIQHQLNQYSVDPKRLMIELTETSAVSDIQDAKVFIEKLNQIGCTVCLDDFGSGFSSFAYLKHLTVEVLKIDGIFIKDLDSSPENRLFVESIQHVSQGMKKTTVAEFVESENIFKSLRALGVQLAQGYYLDKPTKDHPELKKGKHQTQT